MLTCQGHHLIYSDLLLITLRLFLGEQVKGCSLVRDRERFARSRLSHQEAAIHRLVQGAYHQEPQRPPGGRLHKKWNASKWNIPIFCLKLLNLSMIAGHGGLLRLRQGRRALHGRMGAVQGSGRRGRRVQRVRDQGDALPRPRRQHRPRRRADVPGHPVAAAGLSNGEWPVPCIKSWHVFSCRRP